MAARNRMWTPQVVRDRIGTTMIALRLEKHIHGKVKMSPTQVTAALGLLKKTLPDLSVTDINHSGAIGQYTAIPTEQRHSDSLARPNGAAAHSDTARPN